jgi:hypothetical protein
MRNLAKLVLLFNLAGCAHSTIVPFTTSTNGAPKTYPPERIEEVGIYRSTHPFSAFRELGLITFQTGAVDLPKIYDQLRQDSAKIGAQAVVDLKIRSETHSPTRGFGHRHSLRISCALGLLPPADFPFGGFAAKV